MRKLKETAIGLAIGLPLFLSPAIADSLGWYRLRDALIWLFVILMGIVAPAVGLFRLAMLVLRAILWLTVAAIQRLQREAGPGTHRSVP